MSAPSVAFTIDSPALARRVASALSAKIGSSAGRPWLSEIRWLFNAAAFTGRAWGAGGDDSGVLQIMVGPDCRVNGDRGGPALAPPLVAGSDRPSRRVGLAPTRGRGDACLLYTSDAA